MKIKGNYFFTLRDAPKDEESVSGKLLARAGYIKKVSTGGYMLLPLGLRVYQNIEQIIREEMNAAGANELIMPALLPEEIYIKSKRRDNFGDGMFSLVDRKGHNYVLGPTHEELFATTAKMMVKSYKDLPLNLYQIQHKYRDEQRPRYGILRTREFVMKDAYSFDMTKESQDESYQKMYDAYCKIFDRCGLNYKIVRSDNGVMGGDLSEEYQAIADIGEDIIVVCDKCDNAINKEICDAISGKKEESKELKDIELCITPDVGTIDDLVKQGFKVEDMVKTMIYNCDGKFYACLVEGDREVNEIKVRKITNSNNVELAAFDDVERITGAKIGFAGPVGLGIPMIVDEDIMLKKNFLVGANKSDHHYVNTNIRDFDKDYVVADIKDVKEGDICPNCGGKLHFERGIEVGNLFKLGDKYSIASDLIVLDENNKPHYPIMGSYGIGLERIMAAYVEQHHDDKGLVWPVNLSPYKVGIILLNDSAKDYANELHNNLEKNGISVLLDDRDERAGIKFNDMDLIGLPIVITLGKKFEDGIVELKLRGTNKVKEVEISNLEKEIKQLIEK